MARDFKAFIDGSACPPDGDFVLGGYIARAETWAQFTKDWEELLPLGTRAKNGNFHFKMSEMARTPEGQERAANNFDRWKNPYFFLFRNLMDRFHEQRKQFKDGIPLSEKIDFIFDDQTEKSYILAAWDEIVESQPEEIQRYYGATPRFESDQDCLPLQAADFWAWWVREWYEEDASPLPDKMKKRDFGKWHGTKPLPVISISFDESQILDSLQGIVFSSLPRGFRFGEVA
jgi:hypothetical protein